MRFFKEKTELSAKRISYLLYSKKSFSVDFRSYWVLFLAIVCMIVMSCNLIIYNASLAKGENDTVIRNYGKYHLLVEGVDNVLNMKINSRDQIKKTYDIAVVATYKNQNTDSSFKEAKLGIFSTSMDGLYVNIITGEFPRLNEIMISEKVSRAFSLAVGDQVDFDLLYGGVEKNVKFRVSGIFDGCEGVDEYIFTGDDTGSAILDFEYSHDYIYYDKFILFNTEFKPYIIKYTDEILAEVGNVPLIDENGYSLRENYMNNEYVNLERFYEKDSFVVTAILSVLPAAVCILVFSFLDVTKSMKELSTLSMIGTTSKQFFGIMISKYTVICIMAFPIGVIISALMMYIMSLFAKGLNTENETYFSYTISPIAVILLFIFCYTVICGLTYLVAKNTTTTTYSDSLSLMKDMNNIFVRNTSSGLLKTGFRKLKLGLTFFIRNRKANILFCAVVGIIFSVFFYFSIIISQNIGNVIMPTEQSDYTFIPDKLVSESLNTVSESAKSKFSNIDGVEKVVCKFENRTAVDIFLNGHKHMSKPRYSAINTLEKRLNVNVLMFSEEYEQAETIYGKYVCSGSLKDVYEDGTVALFVHTWGQTKEYFNAGDTVKLSSVDSNNKFDDYKIGAVIYMENDQYENINIVRVLTSKDTFIRFTGQTEPNSIGIFLEDGVDKEIEPKLTAVCMSEHLEMINDRELHDNEQQKLKSCVSFYGLLWITVCGIMIVLPFCLTKFLLGSRKDTIKTMYMIGYGKKQLFGIFAFEFAATGVLSAVFGLILSGIIMVAYKKISEIMYIPYYSNSSTDTVLMISCIVGIMVSIMIPCLSEFVYFMGSQFKDNK